MGHLRLRSWLGEFALIGVCACRQSDQPENEIPEPAEVAVSCETQHGAFRACDFISDTISMAEFVDECVESVMSAEETSAECARATFEWIQCTAEAAAQSCVPGDAQPCEAALSEGCGNGD